MGFLKQNINKIILIFLGLVLCLGFLKQVCDPNSSKYVYLEKHFNGKIIYRSYDKMSHTFLIKTSDYKEIYLDDLNIFGLIKMNDSIVKNKNVTYFTVYKKDKSKIVYDMYSKEIKILK